MYSSAKILMGRNFGKEQEQGITWKISREDQSPRTGTSMK